MNIKQDEPFPKAQIAATGWQRSLLICPVQSWSAATGQAGSNPLGHRRHVTKTAANGLAREPAEGVGIPLQTVGLEPAVSVVRRPWESGH